MATAGIVILSFLIVFLLIIFFSILMANTDNDIVAAICGGVLLIFSMLGFAISTLCGCVWVLASIIKSLL